MLLLAMVLLSACLAEQGSGSSGGGKGVPAGASKEEYIAAFADVEPIQLTTQVPSSPGKSGSRHVEAYAKALKEWSGGKITMKIAYGNSVAPPDEAAEALADGRLDFVYVYPLYEPSRYPANAAIADASFLGEHSPVTGSLGSLAAYLEVGMSSPEIMQELEGEGVKTLLPYGPTSSLGLMCTQPRNALGELRGAQVRVSGAAHAKQAEALGMSPVSLPYSEIYQALQRGTIDCAMGSGWSNRTLGIIPLAPHYALDSEVGFARIPFTLGFGLAKWQNLPLVAQQLIYDRLDVYLKEMLNYIWSSMAAAADEMVKEGGTISQFEPDVDGPLKAANGKLLDQVRASKALDGEAFVRNTQQALDKWQGAVKELGYPKITDKEVPEWYAPDKVDLEPYMKRLKSEVLTKHRPS